MLRCSKMGITTWRNNTGLAWTGSETQKQGRNLLIIDYRPIHFGLCKGSSDLIGIGPGGQFLGIEVKRKGGRVSAEQQRFLDFLNNSGARGIAAWSLDDLDVLEET